MDPKDKDVRFEAGVTDAEIIKVERYRDIRENGPLVRALLDGWSFRLRSRADTAGPVIEYRALSPTNMEYGNAVLLSRTALGLSTQINLGQETLKVLLLNLNEVLKNLETAEAPAIEGEA